MGWFEQAIYVTPSRTAIEELRKTPKICDHLYHIRSLNEHHWCYDSVKHDTPEAGLAIIRTIGENTAAQYDLSWHDVPDVESSKLSIAADFPSCVTFMGDELSPSPPPRFLQYLRYISTSHDATVVLYSGFSWGGPVEFEYAWVFGPEELAYCLDETSGEVRVYRPKQKMETRASNIPREAMQHLGIDLPSSYCAFLDSDFDWLNSKVSP